MMMKSIIERALDVVDLEKITKEVMSSITIQDLEMYFVVRQFPDSEHYEFVGLAYSKNEAGKLWVEAGRDSTATAKILELNLGQALTLAEEAGIVSRVR